MKWWKRRELSCLLLKREWYYTRVQACVHCHFCCPVKVMGREQPPMEIIDEKTENLVEV